MSTYMWPYGPGTFRIQTDNPKIVRKLSRRKKVILDAWSVNAYLRFFLITDIRPDNARRMFRHIMGQDSQKTAVSDESESKTASHSDLKQESLSLH